MDSRPLLSQVKAYHKEAFDYISTALVIDEDKNGRLYFSIASLCQFQLHHLCSFSLNDCAMCYDLVM